MTKTSKLNNFNDKSYLDLLLLVILFVSLVNINFFYDDTNFAYYGFCITSLLFVIVYVIMNKQILLKSPILLLGILSFYIIWHSFFSNYSNLFSYYVLINFFLLITLSNIFSVSNFNFNRFFIGIALLATLESLYCIAQFFGLLKGENDFFAVTGTWVNPNITALFLALTAPVFFILFKHKYKNFFYASFILLIIVLLLLKCRSAYIGLIVSFIVFFGLQTNFIAWIKNKKNKISARALFALSILVIFQLGISMYNAKKGSADGRKLIWKLSSEMILEKPIFGYGYGAFEKEYNLFQAEKIKQGKLTTDELENAGIALNAYNEIFQNGVEGGLIGLILILLFLFSLVVTIRKKVSLDQNSIIDYHNNSHFNLAYSGIISFVIMSLTNFSIQAIPVMALFIIYAAIICTGLPNLKLPSVSFISKSSSHIAIRILIISISVYLLYVVFTIANADHQNKKALVLRKEKLYNKALLIMPDLEKYLKYDSYYWSNLGNLNFRINNYEMAINSFDKAKQLSSLPEIYIGAGMSHEKMNQYDKAISNYEQLVLLIPSKFQYRFLLMNTYLKNKNIQEAIEVAKGIIALKPKIKSDKVLYYKKAAKSVLIKFNVYKK